MRDYHSYCNAELLTKDYLKRFDRLFRDGNGGEKPDALPGSPFNGVATLHTDAMSISLRKPKKSYTSRHQQFEVLVTALRIDRSHDKTEERGSTYFILAAHPFVVLEKGDRSQKRDRLRGEMFDDAVLPVAERRYDHLLHEGIDHGKDARLERDESYVAAEALFMRQDYAELAHFMVVKDLTKRFRRVALCMDGNKRAYRSAAAVFAEDMRTGCDDGGMECRRAEIAIVQAQRRSGGRVSSEEQDEFCDRENERVAGEWEDRLAGEMENGGRRRCRSRGQGPGIANGEGEGGSLPASDAGRLFGRRNMGVAQAPDPEGKSHSCGALALAGARPERTAEQDDRSIPAARQPAVRGHCHKGVPGFGSACEAA